MNTPLSPRQSPRIDRSSGRWGLDSGVRVCSECSRSHPASPALLVPKALASTSPFGLDRENSEVSSYE
jgi:hypothetical protein